MLWSIMGLSVAGIGMSVMHDANHGSYSPSSRVNYWLGLTINLLGASVNNWKLQHNILHHTFTNITHMDDDIEDKLVFLNQDYTQQFVAKKIKTNTAYLSFVVNKRFGKTFSEYANELL